MTEPVFAASRWTAPEMQSRLRGRHRAERWFRAFGLAAIGLALAALVSLLVSVVVRGWSAFVTTELRLDVTFDPAPVSLPPGADASARARARRVEMGRCGEAIAQVAHDGVALEHGTVGSVQRRHLHACPFFEPSAFTRDHNILICERRRCAKW